MPSHDYTVVSAPGKVLVAGGYLVLDRDYSGLVVSTSSRFYCAISSLSYSTTKSANEANGESSAGSSSARIRVRAGQFPPAASTWNYELSFRPSLSGDLDQGSSKVKAELVLRQIGSESGRNKFVEITLVKALELAWEVIDRDFGRKTATSSTRELLSRIRGDGEGLELVVLADNDFYSQREQVSRRWHFQPCSMIASR